MSIQLPIGRQICATEGGTIHQGESSTFIALTTVAREMARFVTLGAATHWLAMDHALVESRAWREGMRGH